MTTNQQQHTPEPWHVQSDTDIVTDAGRFIATTHEPESAIGTAEEYTNARRIVACVNACAGISDNELTHGPVIALSRYSTLANEKAELIEALRTLIDAQCKTTNPERIHACALARAILAKVAA